MTFPGDLLVEGLLRRPLERLRRRAADRRMSRGRLDCAFKVISGSQGGLSRRWRHVRAAVSPGRLDARGHWWRLFRAVPTLSIVAVRSPARKPTAKETWSLAANCRIVELQTPTAIISWAAIGDYLPAALAQLRLDPGRTQEPDSLKTSEPAEHEPLGRGGESTAPGGTQPPATGHLPN